MHVQHLTRWSLNTNKGSDSDIHTENHLKFPTLYLSFYKHLNLSYLLSDRLNLSPNSILYICVQDFGRLLYFLQDNKLILSWDIWRHANGFFSDNQFAVNHRFSLQFIADQKIPSCFLHPLYGKVTTAFKNWSMCCVAIGKSNLEQPIISLIMIKTRAAAV